MHSFSFLKKWDFLLLSVLLPILLFGLVALYSIGISREGGDFLYFKKHVLFLVLGVGLMVMMGMADFRFLRPYNKALYVIALILLFGVLLIGKTIRGTTGWFVIAGYQFQPIELVKVIFLVTLSGFWSGRERPLSSAKHLLESLLLLAPLVFFTLLQPDLGSAMMLILIWFGYICLVGLSWKKWVIFGFTGIAASISAWYFVLEEYQKIRIRVLFQPEVDPLGQAYAIIQSKIAIGSGHWFGSGLGFGSQSQLKFLPESHTDFVFSVLAEELGFVGVSILLLFVLLFLLRLTHMSKRIHEDFALFLLLGIVLLFSTQIFLNIAVTLGMIPVTGLPFPFVSYGGSSLLMSFLLLGIVQSIWSRARHEQ